MALGSVPLLMAHAVSNVLIGRASSDLSPLPPWTGLQWGLMAHVRVFGGALAYGLFFMIRHPRGNLTSFTSLTFLTPVFALICGMLLLGERLRPLQWVGVTLALMSVVLIHQRSRLWQGAGSAAALPGDESIDRCGVAQPS